MKVVLMVMPKKHPELPNVPLAIDYAKTDDARRILKYAVHDIATLTRIYFVPPATPKDRVETLRKAFADTLKDPEFLADAKKSKLDIEASGRRRVAKARAGSLQNRSVNASKTQRGAVAEVTTVRGRMSSRFRNCPKRVFFRRSSHPGQRASQQRSTQSRRETLLTPCRRMFELTQHRHEFNCRRRAYNCFQTLRHRGPVHPHPGGSDLRWTKTRLLRSSPLASDEI